MQCCLYEVGLLDCRRVLMSLDDPAGVEVDGELRCRRELRQVFDGQAQAARARRPSMSQSARLGEGGVIERGAEFRSRCESR